MTESFTATAPGSLAKSTPTRRRMLVTGAAGNIGAYFAEHSHQNYDLRLMVHQLDEVENIKFAILHGLSDNRFKRLDISDARALVGYQPQDDLTDEHPRLKQLQLGEQVSAQSSRSTETIRYSRGAIEE